MLKTLNQQLKLEKPLQYLLCLFLFLLPWQMIWIYRTSFLNGVKWEYGTLGFYASEGLLWIIIFLFIVWYCQRIKFQISNFKFQITSDRLFVLSLLSLISYLFFSISWSADKSLALQQALRVMEAILLFLIIFIGPFAKAKLAKWFIYGAIAPSILGIWQFLAQSTFASVLLGLAAHPAWEAGTSIIQSDTIGRWLRDYGPFSHPNVFGGYLVTVIVTLLYCYIVNPSLPSPARGGKGWGLALLTAYCLLITALFFTFSRSAWLATAIVLLSYCFIVKKYNSAIAQWRNGFIILSFIIISVLSVIYFPLVQTRFSSQSISEARSSEERISGYQEAWQIFKKHPVWGVGAGNYTLAAYQLNPNREGWEYQPAHNVFALFAVEQGVVGLMLLLFVVASFFTYHVSHITYQRREFIWYVLRVTCYVILVFFDHYLYSSYVGLIMSAVYFALILRTKARGLHS